MSERRPDFIGGVESPSLDDKLFLPVTWQIQDPECRRFHAESMARTVLRKQCDAPGINRIWVQSAFGSALKGESTQFMQGMMKPEEIRLLELAVASVDVYEEALRLCADDPDLINHIGEVEQYIDDPMSVAEFEAAQ